MKVYSSVPVPENERKNSSIKQPPYSKIKVSRRGVLPQVISFPSQRQMLVLSGKGGGGIGGGGGVEMREGRTRRYWNKAWLSRCPELVLHGYFRIINSLRIDLNHLYSNILKNSHKSALKQSET